MKQIDSFSNYHTEHTKPVKQYKDTLFRKLFSDSKTQLELYNALFGTDLTDESLVQDCTLEDVLFCNRKK